MKPNHASNHDRKFVRYLLGILLAFLALNAFGGGYYGMAGAAGVPLELLEGSPFTTYFFPSLILFIVVGGAFLFAAIAVFARFRFDRKRRLFLTVLVVFVWLAVQVAIIGYVSWMQPATAISATVILILTYLLPKRAF
jgi:hypothetical protein